MTDVYVYPDKQINEIVSQAPEVQAALEDHAQAIASKAQAKLAVHRKTGSHEINLSKGKVDRHVNLDGPGAIALEVGHHDKRSGKWVPGIGVLNEAAKG